MNYPIWEITTLGGGLIIAIVATIHVYIAHFAVGGGFFLVLTEMKARRENNPAMLDYVHRHTKFFLLLTMVAGAITGIGIWLSISAVNPGATSVLIHTFVFAWATEWVCFLVEIVSLLVYYYTFKKMDGAAHVKIGWIYFIAAWLSLVIIGGIISFMLTPGDWPQTKSFFDGFLNPSFVPSVVFRTALALIFAGIYGFITAVRLDDDALRASMIRYCALWLAAPFALLIPAAWWYLSVIPSGAEAMIMGASADVSSFAKAFLWISPVVLVLGLIMILRLPRGAQRGIAYGLLALGLVYMGSFEYVRETSRRPYVIYGYMYSNGQLVSQAREQARRGILASARWSPIKKVAEGNRLVAGEWVFKISCSACHTLGGVRNDILARTRQMKTADLAKVFTRQGFKRGVMPPFLGTAAEFQALSDFLLRARGRLRP